MSYMLDLDEQSDAAIIAEYEKRIKCASNRVCPYCMNCDKFTTDANGKRIPSNDPSCKMYHMHKEYNEGRGMPHRPLTKQ